MAVVNDYAMNSLFTLICTIFEVEIDRAKYNALRLIDAFNFTTLSIKNELK